MADRIAHDIFDGAAQEFGVTKDDADVGGGVHSQRATPVVRFYGAIGGNVREEARDRNCL